MPESSLLLTTAQIGMALAGFAGLIAVLGLLAGHEPAGYFAARYVHFLAGAFVFLRLPYAALPRWEAPGSQHAQDERAPEAE